eukprot:m.834739 g.834739  ORF g.834739 m.834739 type:complete len:557 (+) comp23450_c0_seq5:166-1836(+)
MGGSEGGRRSGSKGKRQAITYDPAKLSWNEEHTENKENKYSYSGKPWDDEGNSMLHCAGCSNWFSSTETKLKVPDTFPRGCIGYDFLCLDCVPEGSGTETLSRKDLGMRGLAICSMYNLTKNAQQKSGDGDRLPYFDLKEHILSYIEEHWKNLWGVPKVEYSVKYNLQQFMLRHPSLFHSKTVDGEVSFALVKVSPQMISPIWHGSLHKHRGSAPKKRKAESMGSEASQKPGVRTKGRRKGADNNGVGGSTSSTTGGASEQAYPINSEGYRYTEAERDPFTAAPGDSFRPARQNRVCLALSDRAPQLRISDDRSVVTGDKGYCMARATHGVNHGSWYYEITILDGEIPADITQPVESHWRVGWAQHYSNLQGPVGLCSLSYSWRDVSGTKFHAARGAPYGDSYKPGDVLGMHIHLPNEVKPPPVRAKPWLVVYKQKEYYEEAQANKVDVSKLKPVAGSYLQCFKNGVNQGVMFDNLIEGTYYPAVSLYMGARVSVNFGPDFKYPPPSDMTYAPMCDAVHWKNAELTLSDILGKVDNGLKAFESGNVIKEEEKPVAS